MTYGAGVKITRIAHQFNSIFIISPTHEAAVMVLPKSKNTAGLGNSLMNDRFGRGRGGDQKKVSAIQRTGPSGETVSSAPQIISALRRAATT